MATPGTVDLKISRYYDSANPDAPAVVRYDVLSAAPDQALFPVVLTPRLDGSSYAVRRVVITAADYLEQLTGTAAAACNRLILSSGDQIFAGFDGTLTLSPVGGLWPVGVLPPSGDRSLSITVPAQSTAGAAGVTTLALSLQFPFPINVTFTVSGISYSGRITTGAVAGIARTATVVEAYSTATAADQGIAELQSAVRTYAQWIAASMTGWAQDTVTRPNPLTVTVSV